MEDKNPIDTFLAVIKKHTEQLSKLDEEILQPHNLEKYPLKDILAFYHK